MPTTQTNRLLGYPDDTRLLIVNADDFGMYPAINEAIMQALQAGIVQSTSLMVPCSAAPAAMQYLRAHPDVSFAIHLTFIRDYPHSNWQPLAGTANVPSLLDETGSFYVFERMEEFRAKATLADLEVEFRAQIEAALTAGLQPTHLDWHALRIEDRGDIFDLMLRLAREYGLAPRVFGQPFIDQVQSQGLPANDHPVLDSTSLPTVDKAARYAQLLRDLPAGLSEWAVHPGLATPEAQIIDPVVSPMRQADFEFLTSPAARDLFRQAGIVLLSYRPLQTVWRAHKSSK